MLEITQKTIEEKAMDLVTNEIFMEMSEFVTDVSNAYFNGVKVESFDPEELYNQTYDEETDEYCEIAQWWAISEYLGETMKEIGDYVLIDLNRGYLWGRIGCGYALSEDMKAPAEYIMTRFNKRMKELHK